MITQYFMHRIKHDKFKEGSAAWDKGIEVHETLESAKQSYHAYLGAYAYGHAENVDYVSCSITGPTSQVFNELAETWTEPTAEI